MANTAIHLRFQPPFDWQKLLAFFEGRATPGVEQVDGDTYRRTLLIGGEARVVAIKPAGLDDQLEFTISSGDVEDGSPASQLARRVFDLDAPIGDIGKALGRDVVLNRMLRTNPGVRVPGAWDGFELTIRAILGQQISVKAATTIAGRIAGRYGDRVDTDGSGVEPALTRLFPAPEKLSRARFNNIGIVRSRAETIRRVSTAVVRGDIRFDSTAGAEEIRRSLKSIKGIGEWTAQYVAMRALRDPDAFPGSDLGLISAIEHPRRVTPKELLARAEQWRPWRAYAAMLLWGSLPGSGG